MVSNGILVICIILSLIFGGSALLFILCLWAVFKDKKERKIMIEGKGLVESLRQLGKYSEFKPNYLLLAADRIEELEQGVKYGEWLQTEEPLGYSNVDCVECSVCHESWVIDEE